MRSQDAADAERAAGRGAGLASGLLLPAVAEADVLTRLRGRHRAYEGSRVRPTAWLGDLACFVFAVAFGLGNLAAMAHSPWTSESELRVDILAGAASCVLVWLRKRWPVGLAIVLSVACTFTSSPSGAALVVMYTLAALRPFRVVAAVGVPALLSSTVAFALQSPPLPILFSSTVSGVGLTSAALGWGMLIRSRHQLVLSLRERARRAEVEAGLRAERARRLVREEVAREMHDVLAHRLSLLSVHAGALQYRPDASREETAQAAKVIQGSAHQALEDLREVIGVLRADEGEGEVGGRLQPDLAELGRLVEESRTSRAGVTLVDEVGLAKAPIPERVGRTAYRIAQEGLTNARKHAPEADAVVTVTGGPGEGLAIEVRNPLPPKSRRRSAIPGSGQGLIGMTERAALVGGRVEHGATSSSDFRLYAWLPWPAAQAA